MFWTSARPGRWPRSRWLTGLLAFGLAALLAGAVLACWQQTEIIGEVATAGSDTDAYQQTAYLASAEMSLLEASLRAPDGARSRQVPLANREVDQAMARMIEADQDDPMPARMLAREHRKLGPDITFYLLQLDRGDHAGALRTLETTIEPGYARIATGLLEAQRRHLAEFDHRQASARYASGRLFWGSILIFILGLATLFLFGVSLLAHRRMVETMAATDALTGLPNRPAFIADTQAALSEPGGSALLLVNFDGFRAVNDQFGHGIGDLLLVEASRRLIDSVRTADPATGLRGDLVARLGGDEFAVLLRDPEPDTAATVAARLIEAFEAPFTIGQLTVDLEVSVGAAIAQPGEQATTVLQHADLALHTAKQGHAGFHQYAALDGDDVAARLNLLGDLRRALDDPGQFVLHYQPQIDLDAGCLAGVEALARWHHPTRGMVSPGEFIPVLESTSLIHRFTDLVLTQALAQARAWLDSGHRIPVAVNISSRSLLDAPFRDRVAALLDQSDVPGDLLCIEITEHTVMRDPATAIEVLHRIRALGVRTSIDDYGTGYSSMSYLKLLPVDEIKVDCSFVADMVTDLSSHALVASTVDLGHNLGLTVVAEGVEDAATADALRALGCEVAQGYHFARPQPADTLTRRIQSGRPWFGRVPSA